ncbi:MAG: hypothetical protein WC438_02865 [Candidatus Pacearchaeota archaeon]
MTIIEFIKANFLVSSVPGGLSLSVSYGFLFYSLLAVNLFFIAKKMMNKKRNQQA